MALTIKSCACNTQKWIYRLSLLTLIASWPWTTLLFLSLHSHFKLFFFHLLNHWLFLGHFTYLSAYWAQTNNWVSEWTVHSTHTSRYATTIHEHINFIKVYRREMLLDCTARAYKYTYMRHFIYWITSSQTLFYQIQNRTSRAHRFFSPFFQILFSISCMTLWGVHACVCVCLCVWLIFTYSAGNN